MNFDVETLKDRLREFGMRLAKEEILAFGLFGSVARQDFDERSDVDIFVITDRELPLKAQDELYYAFSDFVAEFGRSTSVLVYDVRSLKKVPTWQTFNLLRDACFLYDRAGIEDLFKKILQEAEKHGIVYDHRDKVFRLNRPGRVVFSLNE